MDKKPDQPPTETIQEWASQAIANYTTAVQRQVDAATWLEQEVEALEVLENGMIASLSAFKAERNRLGAYGADADAIMTLAEATLKLAQMMRTAMRAHLAVLRAA